MTIVEDIEKRGIELANRFVQNRGRTDESLVKSMIDLSFMYCSARVQRPNDINKMHVIKGWLDAAEAAEAAEAATVEAKFGGKRRRKSRRGRKSRRKSRRRRKTHRKR